MNAFNAHPEKISNFRSVAGVVLILAGGALFVDRYLRTGWLSLTVLPLIGLFLFLWGIRLRHAGLVVIGGILAGIGAGSGAAFHQFWPQRPWLTQVGQLALCSGIGFGIAVSTTALVTPRPQWWALLPSGIGLGLGACLLYSPGTWGDFVLFLSAGTGASLLLWGLAARLFGLVIPGCLVLAGGLGVYMGWSAPPLQNGLAQTGVMLVWFALGWLLITLGGKIILHRYLWWPLIPGGILAVVGWGLYIGGDPDNALGFISNTGAIGLMFFGLYLLLMRKGIHH